MSQNALVGVGPNRKIIKVQDFRLGPPDISIFWGDKLLFFKLLYHYHCLEQPFDCFYSNFILKILFSKLCCLESGSIALCVRQCNYKKSKVPKSKTLLRLHFSSEIIQTFFR